jgi:hypothetical protein
VSIVELSTVLTRSAPVAGGRFSRTTAPSRKSVPVTDRVPPSTHIRVGATDVIVGFDLLSPPPQPAIPTKASTQANRR